MRPVHYILRARKIHLVIILLFFVSSSYGQSLNNQWKQELTTLMEQFLTCKKTPSEDNRCHNFIGRSLSAIYKINDFYSEKSGRFLAVNEISDLLKDSDRWTLLGHSYDQKTLTTAQDYANSKKAVVAVYMSSAGLGHVVLITPGELHPSGSWGLNVPSAISFFSIEPDKSFIDKGLSYAFTKSMMKDVRIYGRNY